MKPGLTPTRSENFLEEYVLDGQKLEIQTFPTSVLKKKALPVTEFNDELRALCKNMLYTMYNAPGIGLAAPQIGKSLRLFVMDVDYSRENISGDEDNPKYVLSGFTPMVVINPVIKSFEGEILYEEGCLSLPGIYEEVKRSEHITLEYQDMFGNKYEMEANELKAICIQHENDHLDGIVFIQRLSLIKKNIITKKLTKQKLRNTEN